MKGHKKGIYLLLVLSLLGAADALYLAANHFQNKIVPCSIGGCETVLTSVYATAYGFPVAGFGVLFYIGVFFLALLFLKTTRPSHLLLLLVLAGSGFLLSSFLVYLQLEVLRAVCMYCMISAGISTFIFLIVVLLFSRFPDKEHASIKATSELYD